MTPHDADPYRRYVKYLDWQAVVAKEKAASAWAITHYAPGKK